MRHLVPAAPNRKRSGHPVFRHSRAGGKPVVRGILGSRLRGNDEVGNWVVNPRLGYAAFESGKSNG